MEQQIQKSQELHNLNNTSENTIETRLLTFSVPDLVNDVFDANIIVDLNPLGVGVFYGHNKTVPPIAHTINKSASIEKREDGYWIIAKADEDNEVLKAVKDGRLNFSSASFALVDYDNNALGGRTFKHIILDEVSLTDKPMNVANIAKDQKTNGWKATGGDARDVVEVPQKEKKTSALIKVLYG